jgi:sugar phosphate isomerase/epimerase
MTPPIGLQLYTVREALARDFAGVMQRIAAAGYVGVEPAFGHLGTSVAEAANLFKTLGLEIPSAHVPLPIGENRDRVLDFMAAMGSARIVSGRGPDQFASLDLIRQTCNLFNQAQTVAAEAGLSFAIHNHWWEFLQVEGRYAYQVMMEFLDPAIQFEIDVYWVQVAGLDPVQIVAEFAQRTPLIHVKDGPAVQGEPMVAVGKGSLDIPAIVRAGQGTAEWLIVELDACETDMLQAVEESYTYLVGEGLAYGRKI